jgi:hypothetical protein
MNQHNDAVRRALEVLAAIAGPSPPNGAKPGRATATVRTTSNLSVNQTYMAAEDPAYWRADFTKWMQDNCTVRAGFDDWGGVGGLLLDFSRFQVARKDVPCTRHSFETLLRDAGLFVREGMVQGLVLKEDLCAINRGAHDKPTR